MEMNPVDFKNFSGSLPDYSQEIIVPVLARAGDQMVSIGTAFCINASGIFMTAGHVINEAKQRAIKIIGDDGKLKEDLDLYVLYASAKENPDGTLLGGLLAIQKAWLSKDHDIAVFRVRMGFLDGKLFPKFAILPLTFNFPAIDSEIIGAGYHTMKTELDIDHNNLNHSQNYSLTTGIIIEIHPVNRDLGMMNFPCFRTNARFDPGMSGGPIFNDGKVCGVICSGYGLTEDSVEYLSYGSLLWVSIGLNIETVLPDGTIEETNLLDWGQKGFLSTDDSITKISINSNEDGIKKILYQNDSKND